ncbi:MAG: hypothetical protein D6781_11870 [Verrucomicrobia bacterium]|nr:MAG: hypothetical protein D6781_11870 [Verrucomicrobiota bacterium]
MSGGRKLLEGLRFAAFYGKEVVACNLRVAADVVSPRPGWRPGVVAVGLKGMSDRQRLILALLVTMTPGTLSLEVDPREEVLYLHTLYGGADPERLRREILENYARPVRLLF